LASTRLGLLDSNFGADYIESYTTAAESSWPLQVCFDIPKVEIAVKRTKHDLWELFKDYHYFDQSINVASRFYVGWWKESPVGCVGVAQFPGSVRLGSAKREHRTVILPDFQGLGIGTRLSDAIGELMLKEGHRYFSRTAHPRFGYHRQNSPLWFGTTSNISFNPLKGVYGASTRTGNGIQADRRLKQKLRLCYSHEYAGSKEAQETYRRKVGVEVWDCFMKSMADGLKRDSGNKRSITQLEDMRERKRTKLKQKIASEGQYGTTAFSKGHVTGPNKMEGLAACGLLKAGKDALSLKIGSKTVCAEVIIDKTTLQGKFALGSQVFGDILSLTKKMYETVNMRCKLKTNSECWKTLKHQGEYLHDLKKKAAAWAMDKKVNPRSIKEWKALQEGKLDKIRVIDPPTSSIEIHQEDNRPRQETRPPAAPTKKIAKAKPQSLSESDDDSEGFYEDREMSESSSVGSRRDAGGDDVDDSSDFGSSPDTVAKVGRGGINSSCSSSSNPLHWLNRRIAKRFGGALYLGQIVGCLKAESSEEQHLLHVVYEDGDSEDLYAEEAEKLVNKIKDQQSWPQRRVSNVDTEVRRWKAKNQLYVTS